MSAPSYNDLLEETKCYACLGSANIPELLTLGLLSRIAGSGSQGIPFSYSPEDQTVYWTDTVGAQSGDLAYFNATADMATVSAVNLGNSTATTVTIGNQLPLLSNFNCELAAVTTINVGSQPNLTIFTCGENSLTGLDLSGCPALQSLVCYLNSITSLDLSGLPDLNYLSSESNLLTSIDLSANPLLATIYLQDNSMDAAAVDAVLIAVNAFGTSGGTIDIRNNAAPTAAGVVAKNALAGRLWTIFTD